MDISVLRAGFIMLAGYACFVAIQNSDRDPGFKGASLQQVHQVNSQSQRFFLKNNVPSTRHEEELLSLLNGDIAARAEEILASDWPAISKTSKYDVSNVCLNHTEIILNGIIAGDIWALRMIDSMGKPPSRLLDFNLVWLGSFDECVSVQVELTNTTGPTNPFSTQYCVATLSLSGRQASLSQQAPILYVGLCMPKTCSDSDVGALSKTLLRLIPDTMLNTSALQPVDGQCKANWDLEWSDTAVFVLVVCSIYFAVMTLATSYDICIVFWLNRDRSDLQPNEQQTFNGHGSDKIPLTDDNYEQNRISQVETTDATEIPKYQPSTAGKALLAFSVYTNASKLLNTSQPAGTFTVVNGIRFYSMIWIIMGHTYAVGFTVTENIGIFLPEVFKKITSRVVINATVAVDTFFVLSGLLVAYIVLKEMEKRGGAGKFKWGMYYLHRFWRLTPPYMLLMMLYVSLMKYWLNGPLANDDEGEACRDTWWHNLLYINNMYEYDGRPCMAWSWYLAIDMQFHIISPLMLVPLYYSPMWGAVSCLAFIATGTMTTAVNSVQYKAGTNMILDPSEVTAYYKIYIKPWCRVAPYAVGIYTGYLLYKCECKPKFSKASSAICWSLSTVVVMLVVYGLNDPDGGGKLGVEMSAFYNATFRLAWGLSISWVIFACVTGNGGPVNTLLSWKTIIPLSRLTYCVYLVHPIVMSTYYFNRRTLMYWYDLEIIYMFFGHSCLSYAAAFVVSLAFESPMMRLEKTLLGREMNN